MRSYLFGPVLFFVIQSASAAVPAQPIGSFVPAWPELKVFVDVWNVTDTDDSGLSQATFIDRLLSASHIWSQCAIRFELRKWSNRSAGSLGASYVSKTEDNLGKIHRGLVENAEGGAMPLVFAGRWEFVQNNGFAPKGLGWAFTREDKLDRLGALISSSVLTPESSGVFIGHELGHALSLPEASDGANVMSGGTKLERAQCDQARTFVTRYLRDFLAK